MNIDILRDEIETLQDELRRSDDPAAQKRIKELIDERETVIGRVEFDNACEGRKASQSMRCASMTATGGHGIWTPQTRILSIIMRCISG